VGLALFALATVPVGAASIYGLLNTEVVVVNEHTGEPTTVVTVPYRSGSFLMTCIDPTGRYLYVSNGTALDTVDLSNRIDAHVLLSHNLFSGGMFPEMQFDPFIQRLVVLTGDGNGGVAVVTVDPRDGTFGEEIATGVKSFGAFSLTTDAAGHRVFFLDQRTTLYMVDLSTRATSSITLETPVASVKYDPATHCLIGVSVGLAVFYPTFVSVTPETGKVTLLQALVVNELIGGAAPLLLYDEKTRIAFVYVLISKEPLLFSFVEFHFNDNTLDYHPNPYFVEPVAFTSESPPTPITGPHHRAVRH